MNNQPTTIDEILLKLSSTIVHEVLTFRLFDDIETTITKDNFARNVNHAIAKDAVIGAQKEAKQAILEDLLALPVAQDEVSQKLTQSNQEWAKYAHIRNAIRQEWRKALTAYFEGEEV